MVIALEDRLKDCGYCLLGRIFVQIKCQDCPSPLFQIFFFWPFVHYDGQFLSLCEAPEFKGRREYWVFAKHTTQGPTKAPTGIIKACTQWFITCSVRGLGTKTSETRPCDGCSSNLPIALKKWSSFKCLSASEIRFSLDKGTFLWHLKQGW